MIVTIESHTRRDTALLRDIFRLRKRVFKDQLGWDVPVQGDQEFDVYDTDHGCVYLASVDETTGRARGALRLMPTTGPHLMRDVFAAWFDEPVVFESATMWEVTRFCVDPRFQRGPYSPNGLNEVTSELLLGLATLCHDMGLTQITGLCHANMMLLLKRSKWPPEIVAASNKTPTGRVYLGLWDISEEVVRTLEQASGLSRHAIMTPAERRIAA